MSFPKKILLGSLLALGSTSVFAADTADLRVIGTIAPTACTPTFAGGATVDYGLIPSSTLNANATTVLASKPISYSITCDAPIAIGTSWTDARSGTSYGGNPYVTRFGLGAQDGVNVGFYTVVYTAAGNLGDGQPVDLIRRANATAAWTAAPAQSQTLTNGDFTHSFAATSTLVPAAYTNYSGTVNIQATIAPTSTLDMSRTITLDGLSTMTVRYL